MDIRITYDCANVDWQAVSNILKSVGMGFYEPEKHQRAFEASHTTVFLFDAQQLIGFGRAISDGAYQAGLYDIAVLEAYQGNGFGRLIIENILARLKDFNIILYASPGKEGFYEKHGFRKMKTGMAFFKNQESMKSRGFTE